MSQGWCHPCANQRHDLHWMPCTCPDHVDRDAQAVAWAARQRREETIQAAFERFHAEHPEVYDLICRFARQLRGRGYEHSGIRMVWERMRWEVAIARDPNEAFKLNDHYHSRYARLVMEQEPDLDGFFRTRELTAL